MTELLWYITAALAIGSGLGVVMLRMPLYSALSLVLHLFTMAAMFAFLDAHFLATTQIIVYAGAIMVLVIFVIMLLSLEGTEKRPSIFLIGIAGAAAFGLLYMMAPAIRRTFPMTGGSLQGDVGTIGKSLYTDYIFSFEIASLLIMVAIVGAVVLAKRIKKNAT
ncbi:MAG: NADH-quinone oxidoreductase subunit J [bacterium]|nr:NADH-quinone oxidoreductase subunit J [bacterium]